MLTWQTASEVNNAGFEVQQRVHGTGKPYETTGYVAGHGTTLAAHTYTYRVADVMPGYHQFRLKQIDYDGSVAYSPEARLAVTLDEGYKLEDPYPNPFNPRAVARFAVQRAQPVHADLYDVLGRRVQELYSGTPAPNQAYTLYVDGTPLAGGRTLSP